MERVTITHPDGRSKQIFPRRRTIAVYEVEGWTVKDAKAAADEHDKAAEAAEKDGAAKAEKRDKALAKLNGPEEG